VDKVRNESYPTQIFGGVGEIWKAREGEYANRRVQKIGDPGQAGSPNCRANRLMGVNMKFLSCQQAVSV